MRIVKLAKPLTAGKSAISTICIRSCNYSARFAPPGKSVLQVSFDVDSDWWFESRQDMSAYKGEKERIAAELVDIIETYHPGISNQIEALDIATPYTTWRYTRNYKGAYMGWMPTNDILMSRVEKTLPGLKNFYMAGQWAMPGGGVLSALYSGRQALQILCNKDGKKFTTGS